MKVIILGGNGFIGRHLTHHFLSQNAEVIVTSRGGAYEDNELDSKYKNIPWDGKSHQDLAKIIQDSDIIINLIGENISSKRWTKPQKVKLLESRVKASKALTIALAELLAKKEKLPQQVIQASASGYYGYWNDFESAPNCLESSPKGEGILADICYKWEEATKEVEQFGPKKTIVRFSPVLGNQFQKKDDFTKAKHAGLLSSMIPPFHYYLGATIGNGKQPFSWVHIDDLVHSIDFIIQNNLKGILNISSPTPVTMREFVETVADIIAKPAYLHIPAPIARLALGEMAEELLINGQKIVPARLQDSQYPFTYPTIKDALKDCLN